MINFDKPRTSPSERLARKGAEARADKQGKLQFEEITLAQHDSQELVYGPRGKRINNIVAFALIGMLALAPLPLASARPVFWMLWSALIFAILALYLLAMQISEPRRPVASLQTWPVLAPALLLPLLGLVQYGLAMTGATTQFAGHTVPLGSIAPEATLQASVRLLGLVVLFVLACEVSTRAERVEQMAWGLFIVVVIHAIWALVALAFLKDFSLWGEKVASAGTATGTFVNRNSFATFLGMGLVAGVCMILSRAHRVRTRSPRGKALLSERNIELIALWMLVAIIGAALLMTQSRMGVFAGFVAAWVAYLAMALKHHDTVSNALLRASGIMFAGAAVFPTIFGAGLMERGVFLISDTGSRTVLYAQIIEMIGLAPWLGTGLDTFKVAYELYHQPPVGSEGVWELAHSTYLAWWLEAGLALGTVPILVLLGVVIILVRTISRRRTNYAVPVMGLAIVIQVALHSTVDFSLEIQANAMFFTVVLGMGLGRLRRKKSSP